MSFVAFLGTWLGKGGYGEFRFDRTYLYTVVVSNISQVGHTLSLALAAEVCMLEWIIFGWKGCV